MTTHNNVLILDTETTGTDDTAVCIEVAIAVYHVPSACVLHSASWLLSSSRNEAYQVNRIPLQALAEGFQPGMVWRAIGAYVDISDAIVAHGTDFDRRFVEPGLAQWQPEHRTVPWICSMTDLQWPYGSGKRQSLVSLALDHGLGVSSAHRAYSDVDLLARLLTRVHDMGHDLQKFLAHGTRPKAKFAVLDRNYDPTRNELAKSHGFRWEPDSREWTRTMAIEDVRGLPFEVRRLV